MSESQADDGQERSQAPTQRKLEKSREQGDVPYSTEITSAATYAALFLVILLAGGFIANRTGATLVAFFSRPDDVAALLTGIESSAFIRSLMLDLLAATSPIFGALAVASIVSLTAQRAVVFSPSKIQPKLNRLSVIQNAKNKYGPNGIGEFVKSLTKMIAISVILLIAFKDRFFDLPFLARLPAQAFGSTLIKEAIFFIGLITFAAVLIAAVDLPWKRYRHEVKLRMTPDEVKKESKETEGDPTMKSERRKRAQEIATNRMLADVPKSDVVIVNPTHYAVALRWDQAKDAAPVCVAKGVDEIAARIRESASEAGVPIHRDPPTARSIFSLVEIGHEIKREHYAAVAAAIHYAEEIRRKAKLAGRP
ncbi:MAG: flagellar type III secretion system protein FlhB [Pseudomonadota bacterium]